MKARKQKRTSRNYAILEHTPAENKRLAGITRRDEANV